MERKYIINPKLAIEKIVRGGWKLKKQALRISSSIKNNIINGWNKGTKYISDNVEKVQKFINLGKAAIKTSEEISRDITRRYQKYDIGIEYIQNEIAEMQRMLNKEISEITGKPYFENVEPIGSPRIHSRIGTPANDNARLRLVSNTENVIADQGNLLQIKRGAGSKVKLDMGPYGKVGGHHPYAKKAFEGNINYNPKKGFAISEEFMLRNEIDHYKVIG